MRLRQPPNIGEHLSSHLLAGLPRPAIIAHRGASRYAPENTLPAFELAVQQGADGVELDVHLTADEHLVVIHDSTIPTPNGRHLPVAGLTLAALRTLASSLTLLPTLDEAFETLGSRLLINVELKTTRKTAQRLAGHVAHTIRRYRLEAAVLCSSFDPTALRALENALPEVPRGLLLPGVPFLDGLSLWAARPARCASLHPHHRRVTARTIRAAHRRSQIVLAYTVNDPQQIRRLFALGIDGIFTDDPPRAQHVRRSM